VKVIYSWLKNFVDLKDVSLEEFLEEFNWKCFEVESVRKEHPKIKGNLLSALIQEIKPHPKADRLQIVLVKTIENQKEVKKEIVCGAKNIKAGQIVPLALVGSEVIDRTSGLTLKIKKSKIRGIESEGMLCSAEEIGLKKEPKSAGIYILPKNLGLGIDLVNYLELKPETILGIESRSNRGDALSILGIAREVSTCFQRPLKFDPIKEKANLKIPPIESLKLKVEESTCEQIAFLSVRNLEIKESPEWLKKRLELSGIKSKNNIIDLTNYVMLEIGQPLHAYDQDLLNLKINSTIEVKKTKAQEEKFLALNEQSFKLDSDCLVISQNGESIALAGIIGGKEKSVNPKTKNILIEAACFNSVLVRKSSRKTGLSTESSRRFERSLDPELVEVALLRIAKLLLEITNVKLEDFRLKLLFDRKQINEKASLKKLLNFRVSEFQRIVGEKISLEEAEKVFSFLGIKTVEKSEAQGFLSLKIPGFRVKDLQREIDLIEEVFRFTKIRDLESDALSFVDSSLVKEFNNSYSRSIKKFLLSQGYSESIFNSLVNQDLFIENYDLFPECPVKMINPLSQDSSLLRNSGIPSLLKAVTLNLKRGKKQVRLFEFGRVYGLNPEQKKQALEKRVLSIVLSSQSESTNWQNKTNRTSDFYELKALLEDLLKLTRLKFKKTKNLKNKYFHPEATAQIINEKELLVGLLGKIHPVIAQKYKIPKNTFVAEIFLEFFDKKNNEIFKSKKIKKINNNPVLERDITADLDLETIQKNNLDFQFLEIENLIKESSLLNLISFKLLSLFDKQDNQKSISIRLNFQALGENKLDGELINRQIHELKNKINRVFSFVSFRE